MTAADCWADLEAKAKESADLVPDTEGDTWFTVEQLGRDNFTDEDAAFIAAANPATILKLIEAARQQAENRINPDYAEKRVARAELLDALKAMRRAFGDPMTRRALGGHNEQQMEAIFAATAAISNAEEAAK